MLAPTTDVPIRVDGATLHVRGLTIFKLTDIAIDCRVLSTSATPTPSFGRHDRREQPDPTQP